MTQDLQFVRTLLGEQRKRVTATVLGAIETRTRDMPAEQQRALKDQVATAINAYHDVCLDILKASVNDGTQVNEDALRLLARVSQQLGELRQTAP